MSKRRRFILKLTSYIAVFVGSAVLMAVFVRTLISSPNEESESLSLSRGPSSVLYDEEGEAVFWDESLDEVERKGKNDPSFRGLALSGSRPKGIFSHAGPLTPSEAERMTGLPAKRARRVLFQFNNFRNAVTKMTNAGQRFVELPLFNDVVLRVRLERPSSYSVNTGVYWGQVENDENSRVRLFVEGSSMNATIETKGRVYKILAADGFGPEHVVLEER